MDVVSASDFIFGCTGEDITSVENWLDFIDGRKILVSASSGIMEFERLIKTVFPEPVSKPQDHFDTITWSDPNGKREITIVNGGFPANFCDGIEWEDDEDIQLTPGLLFGAIGQAASMINRTDLYSNGEYMLDADIQKTVAQSWVKSGSSLAAQWIGNDCLNNLDWLRQNSVGNISIK